MNKKQTRKDFCKTCFWLTVSGFALPLAGRAAGAASPKTGKANQKNDAKEDKMIAYCGLVCTDCPAYIATRKNDDQLRAETAKKWSEQFHAAMKPEDINCDGCLSGSKRLIGHCLVCEIRKCGLQKNVKNCAFCAEYPCPKLDKFLAAVPEAKKRLDEIRKEKK